MKVQQRYGKSNQSNIEKYMKLNHAAVQGFQKHYVKTCEEENKFLNEINESRESGNCKRRDDRASDAEASQCVPSKTPTATGEKQRPRVRIVDKP